MAGNTERKKTQKRAAPQVMNFLNINGMTLSLGDLRKADFSEIEDPKASVKSIQEWAIQVSNILRGFSNQ
jgi:hypothetical protein